MDWSPSFEVPARNWLQLPGDIMSTILLKVGAIDILCNVQNVCSYWRKICKDPILWRVVNLHTFRSRFDMDYNWEMLYMQAVKYSCGQLLDITIEDFGTDKLLHYISQSSKQLRSLRVLSSYKISNYGFTKAVSKFPLLEHLEIHDSSYSVETLVTVGLCSPLLKSLKINCRRNITFECDLEAFAIAENMPKLHELEICCNPLTDKGLEAILDGCPDLEYLDLRLCLHLDTAEHLKTYCAERIKTVWFPDDPFDDSEALFELFGYCTEIPCNIYPFRVCSLCHRK